MDTAAVIRDDNLVAELYRLGVRHLSYSAGHSFRSLSSADLIAGLAESTSARINSSLILLFLRHPEFSTAVADILPHVAESAADTLKLYYQAATYLQRELRPQLISLLGKQCDLPDLFSREFHTPPNENIPVGASCQTALEALGEVHTICSGWNYKWAKSYRQHIPLFIRNLERETQAHAPTNT
ncbi:MAG TPA: hypothetical protein VGK87_16075 [Anaerolineae bacterium]|jgi:hypothetical protein